MVALSQELRLYGALDIQCITINVGAFVERLRCGAFRHIVLSFRYGGGAFDSHGLVVIAWFSEGTRQANLGVHFLAHLFVHVLTGDGTLDPHGTMVNAGTSHPGYVGPAVYFAIIGTRLVREIVLDCQELSTNEALKTVLVEHNIVDGPDLLGLVHLSLTPVAGIPLGEGRPKQGGESLEAPLRGLGFRRGDCH